MAVAETDHLGANRTALLRAYAAEIANRSSGSGRFDQQTDELDHFAGSLERIKPGEIDMVRAKIERESSGHRWGTRSVKPRSISSSWATTEASILPRLVSKMREPDSRRASV